MAQSHERRFDMIVAGTGHSGLILTSALSQTLGDDIRVGVVGPAPELLDEPDNPRAFALSASSKALLQAIGVWDAVAGEAQPVLEIELTDSPLHAGVRPVLLTYENVLESGEPASFIVPAGQLGAALTRAVSQLTNVEVFGGSRIEGFDVLDGGVAARVGGGQVLEASLLIAADGRASALRSQAEIESVGWQHQQTGIVTTVAHEKPHNGRAVQHFLPAGPFAILPLVGNRSCITWSEDSDEAARIMALGDDDFLEEVDLRFGGKLGELELDGQRRSFPLATHMARRFVGDRFALLGDSAHGVHPIAGQGLNLAIRDIAALVECIVDGARVGLDFGDTFVLERYEKWRRFDSTLSAGVFDGINRLFAKDWPLLRAAREIGLGVIDRLPGVKGVLVSEAAGLTGDVPKLLKGETV